MALTLVGVIFLIFLYLTTEKRKAEERASEIADLKDRLAKTQATLQTKTQDASTQLTEEFHSLANDIRLAQNEANQKVNAGFERMHSENTSVRKEVDEKIDEIKAAFKDYSERVNESLSEYSIDNAEFKKGIQKVKEQIQSELQKILTEIKSPLDLD